MGLIRQNPHRNRNRGTHKLLKEFRMATQAEVDKLVTDVKQILTNLGTAKTNIEERFSALEQALSEGKTGSDVDITGLKTAVGELGTPTTELEDLQPVAATPTPPSTAAPTQPDGTAVEHTTDPTVAAAQAGTPAPTQTPEQEAAARAAV